MSKELEQIVHIKAMMEKSTRFLSLSGLSGVAAGVVALIGAWIASDILESETYSSKLGRAVVGVQYTDPVVYKLIILAFAILFAAVGSGLFFTLRKVKKEKVKAWNPSSRRMLFHLFFPLAAGGGFILLLLQYNVVSLVAPCLLIFYGLSLLNASKFTHDDIKQLGIIEVILGLVCGLFPHQGLLFWSIGFGILHILYGIIMYWKYERK